MKVISIIGQEKCDIVFYLSEIYRYLNRHILVIDNSYSQDLYNAVATVKNMDVIERGFVVYTHNVDYSKEAFSVYDYVFIYEGLNPVKVNVENSEHVFIFSDYSEALIRQIREALKGIISEGYTELPVVILRDKASRKITDKLVHNKLEIKSILAGTIPFNMVDYRRYINLSHNGRQTVKGISTGMLDALSYILAEIENMSIREAVQIVKKA